MIMLLIISLLSGCSSTQKNDQNSEIITETHYKFEEITEDEIFNRSEIIAKVKVNNFFEKEYEVVSQIEINGTKQKIESSSLKTVYDFKVLEYYYDKYQNNKESILAYRFGEADLAPLDVGKEYIIFMTYTEEHNEMKTPFPTNINFIHLWQGTIAIEDDGFLFDDAFTSLKDDKVESIYRNDNSHYSMEQNLYKGEDFILKFKKLVEKKVIK